MVAIPIQLPASLHLPSFMFYNAVLAQLFYHRKIFEFRRVYMENRPFRSMNIVPVFIQNALIFDVSFSVF